MTQLNRMTAHSRVVLLALTIALAAFIAAPTSALAAAYRGHGIAFKTPSGWKNVSSKISAPDKLVMMVGHTYGGSDILVQKFAAHFPLTRSNAEEILREENRSVNDAYANKLHLARLGGHWVYQANLIYRGRSVRGVQDIAEFRGNTHVADVVSQSAKDARQLATKIFSTWRWI